MTNNTGGGSHNRGMERLDVSWDAKCRFDDTTVNGQVLDLSIDGGFFAVQPNSEDPNLEGGEGPTNLAQLEQGASIDITLPEGKGQGGSFKASVKWTGFSNSHQLWGIGFHIDVLGLG